MFEKTTHNSSDGLVGDFFAHTPFKTDDQSKGGVGVVGKEPTIPEREVESSIVPTAEELTTNLQDILENPQNLTAEEYEGLRRDVLAGRTWYAFVSEEEIRNPDLVAAFRQTESIFNNLDRRKEQVQYLTKLLAGGDNSQETEGVQNSLILADVKDVEVTRGKNDTLELSVATPQGEKRFSLTNLAILAALVVFDMFFLKGTLVAMVNDLQSTIDSSQSLLQMAGIDLNLSGDSRRLLYENFLANMRTEDLENFLNGLERFEMEKVVDGIEDDTLKRMLNKQPFGGLFKNQHSKTLAAETLQKITQAVDKNRLERLNIKPSPAS